MLRDEAHIYYGASMKAQHKCLPDGSGMGKGYEIYLNQQKAAYTATKLNTRRRARYKDTVNSGTTRRNS